jgi:hypothetical protein
VGVPEGEASKLFHSPRREHTVGYFWSRIASYYFLIGECTLGNFLNCSKEPISILQGTSFVQEFGSED